MTSILKVALLRGINVGGHNKIKMADLVAALQQDGFENVSTYIQSGNIFFASTGRRATLESKIADLIKKKFGHDVPVLVRDQNFFRRAIEQNPFPQSESSHLHATFLSKKPTAKSITALDEVNLGKDEIQVVCDVLYLHCPNGYTRTKLTNAIVEKILGVRATTRNWRTLNVLAEPK